MKREQDKFASENELVKVLTRLSEVGAGPRGRGTTRNSSNLPSAVVGKRGHARVTELVTGIGDDCAVVALSPEHELVLTTDALVDKVHFDLRTVRSRPHGLQKLGIKSVQVNLSDIASMGATPKYALLTIGIPEKFGRRELVTLFKGVISGCRDFGAALVGGDTVRSEVLTISVTLIGEVARGEAVMRSGAKDEDLIMVTGTLGLSALGLALLTDPSLIKAFSRTMVKRALARHETPVPRVIEGSIAASLGATAMIDVSDGMLLDLSRLLEASSCRGIVLLQDVPYERGFEGATELEKLSRMRPAGGKKPGRSARAGLNMEHFALSGGEDYELIMTAPTKAANKIKDTIEKETGTPVSVIGRIDNNLKRSVMIDGSGRVLPLVAAGFDHFSGSSV